MRKRRKLFCATALTAAAISSLALFGAGPATPPVITAHTEPSEIVQMNFPGVALVKKVAIKEGQTVNKGDLLLAQDDEMDQLELDRLNGEAKSNARIEYYEAARDFKKKTYDRQKNAKDGFSPQEIENAELDYVQAEKQIEVSKLDHRGDDIKAKQQEAKVKRMNLSWNPENGLPGKVKEIRVHEGELTSVDPDKPAIIVVQNSPCDVVVGNLYTWQVSHLKLGQTLQVKYPDQTEWQDAKITFVSPYADPGTHIQTVKLELPNMEGRDTGQQVQVKLPPDVVAAEPPTGISSLSR